MGHGPMATMGAWASWRDLIIFGDQTSGLLHSQSDPHSRRAALLLASVAAATFGAWVLVSAGGIVGSTKYRSTCGRITILSIRPPSPCRECTSFRCPNPPP